jgi:hypothetical protein
LKGRNVAVPTVPEFDADFVDPSLSFPLPSEMEDINEANGLHAVKMEGLGAARGVMTAIALEIGIPLFLYLAWHFWHNWR